MSLPEDIENIIMDYKTNLEVNHDFREDLDLDDFKTKDEYFREILEKENSIKILRDKLKIFFENEKEYFNLLEQKLKNKVKLKQTHQKILNDFNHLSFYEKIKLRMKLRKQKNELKKEIKRCKKEIIKKLNNSGINWKDLPELNNYGWLGNFQKIDDHQYLSSLSDDEKNEIRFINIFSYGLGVSSFILSIILLSVLLPPVSGAIIAVIVICHIFSFPFIPGLLVGILLSYSSVFIKKKLKNIFCKESRIINYLTKQN